MRDTQKGRLTGRVALVTGAGRGMGRAIAIAFADEQAAVVVINYRASREAALETVAEVKARGADAVAVSADVSRKADADEMLAFVGDRFGQLDILVNNAGMLSRAPIDDLTEEDWDRSLGVNLKSAFLCTQASLPLLRRSPAAVILNMASGGAGMHGQAPRLAHYYAAKGGLITLSKCLATELAPIRVNCLAPGFTETGFGGTQPGTRERVMATTPLGRVGQPRDVAEAAVFLASDEASFITGHVLVVDGGRTM